MVKKFDRLFLIMVVSFATSAGVLAFIPLIDLLPDKLGKILSIVIGALFWIGLICAIVMNVRLSSMRRNVEEKIPAIKSRMKRRLPGVIAFEKSLDHLAIYGIFAISFILIIVDTIFGCMTRYLMFPVVTLAYLSFVAHCVIDGKNFKVYRVLKKGSKKASAENGAN